MPLIWLRKNNMSITYSIIKITNIIIHSFIIIYLLNNIQTNLIFPINLLINYKNTNKTISIFYSNLIISIINSCILSPIYVTKIKINNFDINLAYKILKYGIPVMISNISFCVNENLDKIIIKRYISSYYSGGYSACYKIATCISLYITAFKLGVEPYIFKKSQNKYVQNTYLHINYIFIIIGVIIYTLLCANLKIIYKLIIHNKYEQFLFITPIIMLSNFLFGIYNNMSISYKILNKPYIGAIISLIGVITTIIFNILTIMCKKIIVSAIGTVFCYIIMLLFCYIWNINNYKSSYITARIILHITLSIIISFFLFKTSSIVLNILGQTLYLIFIYTIENKEIKKIFKM
jgi:O-antigen/teichoic acid export membrane protein